MYTAWVLYSVHSLNTVQCTQLEYCTVYTAWILYRVHSLNTVQCTQLDYCAVNTEYSTVYIDWVGTVQCAQVDHCTVYTAWVLWSWASNSAFLLTGFQSDLWHLHIFIFLWWLLCRYVLTMVLSYLRRALYFLMTPIYMIINRCIDAASIIFPSPCWQWYHNVYVNMKDPCEVP